MVSSRSRGASPSHPTATYMWPIPGITACSTSTRAASSSGRGCGWESQNVTNKPYIAVDPQGSVAITCPDQARLIQFGADAQKLRDLPLQGNGSPVGVAVASDGRLLVADARGNVVDAIPAQ